MKTVQVLRIVPIATGLFFLSLLIMITFFALSDRGGATGAMAARDNPAKVAFRHIIAHSCGETGGLFLDVPDI